MSDLCLIMTKNCNKSEKTSQLLPVFGQLNCQQMEIYPSNIIKQFVHAQPTSLLLSSQIPLVAFSDGLKLSDWAFFHVAQFFGWATSTLRPCVHHNFWACYWLDYLTALLWFVGLVKGDTKCSKYWGWTLKTSTEARLAPGIRAQMYRDWATFQLYSNHKFSPLSKGIKTFVNFVC